MNSGNEETLSDKLQRLNKFLTKNEDKLFIIGAPIFLFVFRNDILFQWNKSTGRDDSFASAVVIIALLFGGLLALVAVISTLMHLGFLVVLIGGKMHRMTVLHRRQIFERTRLQAMRGIPEEDKGPVMRFYKKEIGYPWFKFGYKSKKTFADGEEKTIRVGVMYLSKRFDPRKFPPLNDEHAEVPNGLWLIFYGIGVIFIVSLCVISLKLFFTLA